MVRSSALPLFACSTSAEESIWIFEDGWLVQDPTSFCWDRGDGRTDGQTGRRHGQRFAILHAKEKNDIVLRCGPSPCLSRARLPSQTEAALPDVCSPTVRYGTYLSIAAFLRLPSLFSNPDFENLWLMHYPDENLYL